MRPAGLSAHPIPVLAITGSQIDQLYRRLFGLDRVDRRLLGVDPPPDQP
jgi:hypothetical protein